MEAGHLFELIVAMLVAVSLLYWVAEKIGCPPSTGLLIGGAALAFVPGVPAVRLDPGLVLVLFLPPLLADGAWFTEVARFRRHVAGIASLAIGAVIFSTAAIALVTHWLLPTLPWAACAALGAIVSPPDAVSARAVLARVQLPRRLNALLEGESLLNDATGLVILRFAVAAAAGSGVAAGPAIGRCIILVVGGIAVGLVVGACWTWLVRRLRNDLLVIIASVLSCWVAYIAAERVGVSGVFAVVAGGMTMGWRQHELLSAQVRVRAGSLWQVLVFLMEVTVFVLIGFSLRDVLARTGGLDGLADGRAWPTAAIILSLVASRFAWVFASELAVGTLHRLGLTRERPLGAACATVLGWAGMRGVVTLAAALTLPIGFPGRDLVLLAAFATILVTVLVQGSTLGLVIRALGVRRAADDQPPLDLFAAEAAMMKAQLVAVERLARDEAGEVVHPQLLRRYTARATIGDRPINSEEERATAIAAHFDVVIGAVRAGRAELVRLHRAHRIDDETLRDLEHDLDLDGRIGLQGLSPSAASMAALPAPLSPGLDVPRRGAAR